MTQTTGTITSDCDGCIKEAVRQCSPHRSRQLKQAVARRGAKDEIPDGRGPRPSPSATWKRHDGPSSRPKRAAPSPTWEKDSQPPSYSKPSPSPTWEKDSHPPSYSKSSPSPTSEKDSHPKRAAPSPTSEKDSHPSSYSKPSPSPSPSPTWKSETQPPKQEECNYMCPQEDLAKTQLTDETIQDSSLLCSYSSPDCKCKYSKVRCVTE